MILIIEKSKIDRNFLIFICKLIRQKFFTQLNPKQIKVWDDYLNENYPNLTTHKKISTREILIAGVDNLYLSDFEDNYLIHINMNSKMPYYKASIYTMCKMINYGTADKAGYPIFTNTFNHIKDNIDKYKFQYNLGRRF